ncbi:hypothetical protein BN1182_AB_00650 [Pantoea ananatis]|nr:hypothetical protein BN1182_AB_00650 [Pantoea ananatis]
MGSCPATGASADVNHAAFPVREHSQRLSLLLMRPPSVFAILAGPLWTLVWTQYGQPVFTFVAFFLPGFWPVLDDAI